MSEVIERVVARRLNDYLANTVNIVYHNQHGRPRRREENLEKRTEFNCTQR